MRRLDPPEPKKIRSFQDTRPFAWFDKRINWFWADMTHHEILLYFYLVTEGDMTNGCSHHSSREITRILKIGPASLIKARKNLEKRRLIAVSKDDLSNRTIYQVMPLPISENDRVGIPMLVNIDKKKHEKKKKLSPKKDSDHEMKESNIRNIQKLQEMFDRE